MEDDFWEKSNHELNRYSPQQTIVPPTSSPTASWKEHFIFHVEGIEAGLS